MQTAIPCLFMRGGTSRGPFFNAADLLVHAGVRSILNFAPAVPALRWG